MLAPHYFKQESTNNIYIFDFLQALAFFEKLLTPHVFEGKQNLLQVITMHNFMVLEICQVSGSDETPIPGVTKLKQFFTRCPLMFTHWLG